MRAVASVPAECSIWLKHKNVSPIAADHSGPKTIDCKGFIAWEHKGHNAPTSVENTTSSNEKNHSGRKTEKRKVGKKFPPLVSTDHKTSQRLCMCVPSHSD